MVSDAQKAAAQKWDRENMTNLACKVTREKADRFRKLCAEEGTNVNAVLLEYVNRLLEAREAQG